MNKPVYPFREIGIGHYPMGNTPVSSEDSARLPSLMNLNQAAASSKLAYVHIPFCDSICPFCPYPKAFNEQEPARNIWLRCSVSWRCTG